MACLRTFAGVVGGFAGIACVVAGCLFPPLDDLTGGSAVDAGAFDAVSGGGDVTSTADASSGDGGGDQTKTFVVVADAWVRSGSSVNTNNGANPRLFIVSVDPDGAERRAFLKFDVTGLGGAPVRSATLKLACASGADHGGNIHAVEDATWAETGITWTSAPKIGAIVASIARPITADAVAEVDVTSAVREGPVSLAVTSPSADEVQYWSREGDGGAAPTLVVTF